MKFKVLTLTLICFILSGVSFCYAESEKSSAELFTKSVQEEKSSDLTTPPAQEKIPEAIPEIQTSKPRCLESVEFLTGWGWSKVKSNNGYDIVPFIVDFNFGLKPLIQKIGLNTPGLLQFQLEPFISLIEHPGANVEVGTLFSFKIGLLPETWKFQPYIKGGIGMLYESANTREQATKFNFNEIVGVGAHYYFSKNTAITLEGRYRHISNAGIDHPNNGINTYIVLTGISYKY